MMGSENGYSNETPVHQVTIGKGFYIGKYEVTQTQWQRVMGNNPSSHKGPNLPVENMSWDNTQEFIQRLNVQSDGHTYRLPSEAEWEYAARAGTTGDDAGDIDAMAWYLVNAGDARLAEDEQEEGASVNHNRTHPVGIKRPNAWGLFDMYGNVREWCQDLPHGNYAGAPTDGSAWLSDGDPRFRVWRGGSAFDHSGYCRSAARLFANTDYNGGDIGIRVDAITRQ
jgi:formylglycine-generating enzyme required for sulfatase activity